MITILSTMFLDISSETKNGLYNKKKVKIIESVLDGN